MRDKKSDPNRWTAEQADSETDALPTFGEGLAPARSAFEELRRYPFFFADEDDDDEPAMASAPPVTHAELERSAAAPAIPAPLAEIRPLLPQTPQSEVTGATGRPVAPRQPTAPTPPAAPGADADTLAPIAASLAERHAAALARKHAVAAIPPIAPPEVPVSNQPSETAAVREEVAPAPPVTRATPVLAEPQPEPWYNRVPTGISLVAVIAYFLIGGIALIGTGLVLGGLGGTLMALFGLAVTSVAAFVAWQELTR